MSELNKDLVKHVEETVLPLYNKHDKGHDINHAREVIDSSILISGYLDKETNKNMVFTIAAYHDIGLGYLDDREESRERHHELSGQIVREDNKLKEFFSDEQIEIIAEACEQHRASFEGTPNTIYGKVVADADRMSSIDITSMIKRSYNYNIDRHPGDTPQERYQNVYEHLVDKYGPDGYGWESLYLDKTKEVFYHDIKESKSVLDNEERFLEIYQELFNENVELISEVLRQTLLIDLNN